MKLEVRVEVAIAIAQQHFISNCSWSAGPIALAQPRRCCRRSARQPNGRVRILVAWVPVVAGARRAPTPPCYALRLAQTPMWESCDWVAPLAPALQGPGLAQRPRGSPSRAVHMYSFRLYGDADAGVLGSVQRCPAATRSPLFCSKPVGWGVGCLGGGGRCRRIRCNPGSDAPSLALRGWVTTLWACVLWTAGVADFLLSIYVQVRV